MAERRRHFLDGQPGDPGKCQKQRRRAEIDQLPAAPDVAKQVAETIGYPTPNLAARKLLSPEVANDKTLYPDAETIKNGEWQNDVGSASSIYEEYYQKLKAGR